MASKTAFDLLPVQTRFWLDRTLTPWPWPSSVSANLPFNLFLMTRNIFKLETDISHCIVLYQQAQHPRYNFFSPNGILELRAASPSPLRRVMEQVRAVYKEHRLIMSDTIVDRSMVRAGPDRAKVNVVELVPLASVGPVKNVRRMRSLP